MQPTDELQRTWLRQDGTRRDLLSFVRVKAALEAKTQAGYANVRRDD